MKNILKKIYSLCFIIKENIKNKNKLSLSAFFWKTKLSHNVRIQSNCRIINFQIDYYSYIGDNSYITDCKVGKFCSISSNLNCAFGKHPTKKFVSTHPYFYSTRINDNLKENIFDEYSYPIGQKKYRAIIGNDVWIGSNVTLLDGITIGDGAIIGACTLVNKSVPPYAIVVGIPGKIIGYRFEKSEIEFLENLKWWDRDINWINNNSPLFKDIKILKEKMYEQNN